MRQKAAAREGSRLFFPENLVFQKKWCIFAPEN